jgi:cytoskeleton protein RodZ
MGSFGENLRREREMRGVTLEEIAESTRISTRLLRALEQEQFSELPGGVFTRSFIRHYANYLGLDAERVLAEYRQVAQPQSDYDLHRLPAANSSTSKPGPRGTAIPWVVAAILLGGGYATYRYAHRPEASLPPVVVPAASAAPNTSTPASASSPPVAAQGSATKPAGSENAASPVPESATHNAQVASPTGGDNSSVPAASGTASDAASGAPFATDQQAASSTKPTPPPSARPSPTATPPVLGDGNLVLRVATSEDAWLAVAADGKTLMQRTLPANSVRIFRANDAFDVTTGNAEGTSLTLNGEPQKPLGRHGEFRKVHLTRDALPSPAKPVAPSN